MQNEVIWLILGRDTFEVGVVVVMMERKVEMLDAMRARQYKQSGPASATQRNTTEFDGC